MDTKILEEVGLTPGEIKTYLALLKIGLSSTGPIAKESQVSRSKLYSILDKLEKKGMSSHVVKKGVIYFQAAEPVRIKEYLSKKEQKIKQLGKEFDKFLPQLTSFEKESKQKVSLYQGLKGLITVHEYMYLKLKKGGTYYSIGIPSTQPEPHHLFWKRDHIRRSQAGIKAKLLFNKDVKRSVLNNRNTYKGCEARYIPLDLKTPSYFEMYADTVMIVIPSKDPITIEIVSKEISKSFMVYFNEFWRASK